MTKQINKLTLLLFQEGLLEKCMVTTVKDHLSPFQLFQTSTPASDRVTILLQGEMKDSSYFIWSLTFFFFNQEETTIKHMLTQLRAHHHVCF